MQRRNMVLGLMAGASAWPLAGAWAAAADGVLEGLGLRNRRFDWLPSECAHERWPMQLIEGAFASAEGPLVPIPTGKIVNNGLGLAASLRIEGAAQKPVPEKALLRWYSFAEDRFFGGEVALPQAELRRLFQAGLPAPHHPDDPTWSRIIVGMGLGGWAQVWLAGGQHAQEVARVRLPEIAFDWRRVIDNPALARADYRRKVLLSRTGEAGLAALEAAGAPVEQWPRYSQRQAWSVRLQTPHQPLDCLLRFVNGERRVRPLAATTTVAEQPLPKHMQLTWQPASGSRLRTEIHFDEQEVFDVFERASATAPLALVMDYPRKNRLTVVAEVGGQSIPLTQARIDVSSLG